MKHSQVFYGAPDLDIPGASSSKATTVGRIYVRAKSKVSFSTKDDITPVLLEGNTVVPENHAEKEGWHTIVVNTKSEKVIPFALSVTYEAPSSL